MARQLTLPALAAVTLSLAAAVTWAAAPTQMRMQFEVSGMRLVMPQLPEEGARPPARFFAGSATGTMAETLVVFAHDITGHTDLRLQGESASQPVHMHSTLAVIGQPEGTIAFPENLRVQWGSGELTAASGLTHGNTMSLTLPIIRSAKMDLRADQGVLNFRKSGASTAMPIDATFTSNVQVQLR